jgi:hypothetical protein
MREEFDAAALPDVVKVRIANNQFGLKYRMLRAEPKASFLLYRDGARPDDIHNWLLDIELAHGAFRADQIALWRADLALPERFDALLSAHREFFRAAKRLEKLKARLRNDDTETMVRLRMLAISAGSDGGLGHRARSPVRRVRGRSRRCGESDRARRAHGLPVEAGRAALRLSLSGSGGDPARHDESCRRRQALFYAMVRARPALPEIHLFHAQRRTGEPDAAAVRAGREPLREQAPNLKTLFDFTDGSLRLENFRDRDHFIRSYPFISYQYPLFQLAIQNLSEHNAFEGKHSSVGERSMLGVFQDVAKTLALPVGRLATFDQMFEGIRTALKSNVQQSILTAEHNLDDAFAVLTLARELAASADGLTIEEMASVVHASRRSAERMRDAVEAAFGVLR